jgi:hypothetical protein
MRCVGCSFQKAGVLTAGILHQLSFKTPHFLSFSLNKTEQEDPRFTRRILARSVGPFPANRVALRRTAEQWTKSMLLAST